MKKLCYNLKPFLIFQAFVIFICLLLKLISPQSDAWVIISYGIIGPYYFGYINIIGALFGAWTQFRSENKLKIIICNNIFTFILIIISVTLFFPKFTFDIFLIALHQFLYFIAGQFIILTLEFIVFICDLIKKNDKEKK